MTRPSGYGIELAGHGQGGYGQGGYGQVRGIDQ